MFEEALGCIKIYEDGEFTEHMETSMFSPWRSYINSIYREPKENVWYDKIEDVCFGEEKDFYCNPTEFSFFSRKEGFLSNEAWGSEHVQKRFGNFLGDETKTSDDYIIQNNSGLEKFKDKTIMVVGGGPSAKDHEWKDEEYDYIWSCTKFYLNEDIVNDKLALVSIGGNVDLKDEDFLSALEKTGAMCGFECGVSPFKQPHEIVEFKNKFGDKVFYFHPRYFSKLGSAARLICLAAFLGAKEVKFVGFDGDPVGQKHAFEDNKINDEVWRNNKTPSLYRRQMVLFWEYMSKFDIKYTNLGEGHPNNLSTEITRKYK